MATISEAEYRQRVEALERLNASLSAQVDRQAKVVEAALRIVKTLRQTPAWTSEESALEYAARVYEVEMAELAKGERG